MSGIPLGFGLLQGGGQYGGPISLARARDPRYAMAQAMIDTGTSGAPARTNLEGLSRAGQALVGAWLMKDANNEYNNRESNRSLAIANALRDASGMPAETKSYGDGTTINWDAVKPNMNKAIGTLAANPDTADTALQWQKGEMDYQRQRQATQEDRSATQAFTLKRDQLQNNYQTAHMNLQQAFAAAQQDKSIDAQQRLQKAQQDFTAAQGAIQRQWQLDSAGPMARAQADAAVQAQLAPAPSQYQTEGAPTRTAAEVLAAAKNAPQNAQNRVTNEGKLRDDFNGQQAVKNYKEVVPIVSAMKSAADTPAGDLNLIYGLGKIMDPNSVVREGELALAIKAGSPAERLQGIWNYVAGGGRLSPEQRQNMMAEAMTRFGAHQDAYNQLSKTFTDIANRSQLDPRNVITGIEVPQAGMPGAPAAQPNPADIEAEMRRRGLLK